MYRSSLSPDTVNYRLFLPMDDYDHFDRILIGEHIENSVFRRMYTVNFYFRCAAHKIKVKIRISNYHTLNMVVRGTAAMRDLQKVSHN